MKRILSNKYWWLAIVFALKIQAYAQADFSFIKNQFDQYRKNVLQEKLYVHTDKNFYLSGEIIWFKLYNVDASFHKL